MAATYVAGPGVLIGAGAHWLLLADAPEASVLDRWFRMLTGPGAVTDVLLESVDGHYRDPQQSFVLVDLSPGRERSVVRGRGSVSADGEARLVGVGLPAEGPGLPFIGGVVAAGSVRLVVAGVGGAASAPGIIDGIPPEILASSAAPRPEPTAYVDLELDGHTKHRGDPDHLRQSTHQTVLAAICLNDHPTPTQSNVCRVCGAPVPPQEPQRVLRPVLGRLVLPSGEWVTLDRDVVFGRKPGPLPDGEPWPHLVTLPEDSTYLSRVHLQIELDGWLVLARDLGSRSGTILRVPGRPPERIRANEPHVLEPGHRLDLADVYEVVYEVTP